LTKMEGNRDYGNALASELWGSPCAPKMGCGVRPGNRLPRISHTGKVSNLFVERSEWDAMLRRAANSVASTMRFPLLWIATERHP